MSKFELKTITIYHKNGNNWDKYQVQASVRNTAYLNHTKNGSSTSERALVRVFDYESYNKQWYGTKGDVIVDGAVEDTVTNPLTELKAKYGEDNVYKISTVDKFIFIENSLKELCHIKFGGV